MASTSGLIGAQAEQMADLGDMNREEAISHLAHKVGEHHIASEPSREPTPPLRTSSPTPEKARTISRVPSEREANSEETQDGLLDETNKEVEEGEIVPEPIMHSTLRD